MRTLRLSASLPLLGGTALKVSNGIKKSSNITVKMRAGANHQLLLMSPVDNTPSEEIPSAVVKRHWTSEQLRSYRLTLALKACKTLDQLFDTMKMNKEEMDISKIATAFRMVAHLMKDHQSLKQYPEIYYLASQLKSSMDDVTPGTLACVARSHAILGHGGSDFIDFVVPVFVRKFVEDPRSFNDSSLFSILWAFNKMNISTDRWANDIMPSLCEHIQRMNARCIYQAISTFASLHYKDHNFLSLSIQYISGSISKLPPQYLVSLALGYAKLEFFDYATFNTIFESVSGCLDELSSNYLSKLVCAFALYLSHCSKQTLVNAAADPKITLQRILDVRGLGDFKIRLFEKLSEKINMMSIQCLMYLVSAFKDTNVSQGLLDKDHWEKICRRLEFLIEDSAGNNNKVNITIMTVIVSCLASTRYLDARLMNTIAAAIMLRLGNQEVLHGQLITTLIASYGYLNRLKSGKGKELCQVLCQRMKGRLTKMRSHMLLTCVLGLLTGGYVPKSLFRDIQSELLRRIDLGETLSTKCEVVLYQAFTILKILYPHLIIPEIDKTISLIKQDRPGLHSRLQTYHQEHTHYLRRIKNDPWDLTQKSLTISSFQMDVSFNVGNLGFKVMHEYMDHFWIDIIIYDAKVAIEADGPYHFALNVNEPTGNTLLKRRVLEALGWKLVSVPYYEWFAMSNTEEKLEYLKEAFRKVGLRERIPRLPEAIDKKPALK